MQARDGIIPEGFSKQQLVHALHPTALDFQTLVEAVGDVIYTLDLKGRCTYVNAAVEQVLGYCPNDFIGNEFTQPLTPDSAKIASRHFEQGVHGRSGTPFFEVEAIHSKGHIVHLEVRAGPLMLNGQLIGRIGIARNISEVKALHFEVLEKTRRMEHLEERTRLAMRMYTRIAELFSEDMSGANAHDDVWRELEGTLAKVNAQKYGLTAIDLHVLELLAQGQSNDQIAHAICRSPHTAKDYVRKIMQRLGATRRAQAVAYAHRLGLLVS